VSEREATSLERLGLGSRIAVAPLGVEIPKIDAVARKSHDEPLRLLFLSRIHPKKNLPALLTAMKEVVSDGVRVDLRVVGDADPGEEQYSLSLRRLADDMALAEYITFTGIAGGEEKKREFYRAHVFVLASYEENFGISVVEAMAYGLPVIVSDQVALAHEVARSRAGLVVRCQDVKALAAAIRTLAADENERVDMARRARSLAQRYSWSEVVSGLVSLYGRALNGRLP
jgi:glycosyltransferase involved in cell wall biosynthesis